MLFISVGSVVASDIDFTKNSITHDDSSLINENDTVPINIDDNVSLNSTNSGISIQDILDAAIRTKTFIETHHQLPNYITIAGKQYSCANALYLYSKAIVNINNGDYSDIEPVSASEPSQAQSSLKDSSINKAAYLDVNNRVANYIKNNGCAPRYADSTIGQISYYDLLLMDSNILTSYANDGSLPDSVIVKNKTEPSGHTVQEVADSICSGLTNDHDKAVALYNFVRDDIDYEYYYNTQKGAQGTLDSGAGNCCDQAQLLVAMFRSQGLNCRFVHGTCTFSSGSVYGHVWTQVSDDGQYIVCDPTSTRNAYGVINNWNTKTAIIHGYYDNLPFLAVC